MKKSEIKELRNYPKDIRKFLKPQECPSCHHVFFFDIREYIGLVYDRKWLNG